MVVTSSTIDGNLGESPEDGKAAASSTTAQ